MKKMKMIFKFNKSKFLYEIKYSNYLGIYAYMIKLEIYEF